MNESRNLTSAEAAAEMKERAIRIAAARAISARGILLFGAPIDESWPVEALLGAISLMQDQLNARNNSLQTMRSLQD